MHTLTSFDCLFVDLCVRVCLCVREYIHTLYEHNPNQKRIEEKNLTRFIRKRIGKDDDDDNSNNNASTSNSNNDGTDNDDDSKSRQKQEEIKAFRAIATQHSQMMREIDYIKQFVELESKVYCVMVTQTEQRFDSLFVH